MRCPHCDSEVESGDPYCPMCGNRLVKTRGPSRTMSRLLTLAILAVAVVVCVGGGIILSTRIPSGLTTSPGPTPALEASAASSPTSTPQTGSATPSLWTTYTSAQLGISLRYPESWLVREDADLRRVVFALRQDDLQIEGFPSGTGFVVVVEPASELGTEAPDEVLDSVSGRLSSIYQHLNYGEVLSVSIDGVEGALMQVDGEFDHPGLPLRSWIAAAIAYEHAYVFFASAPLDDWMEQEPIFREMLHSVGLSEPTAWAPTASPTPLPSPTPLTLTPVPAPSAGPDAYEPDDSIGDATLIVPDGLPRVHNLHVEGDHDYVCFQASAGTAYTIETHDLGPEIDTTVYLYDSQGAELAHNDDGTEEPLASRIVWLAPSSGVYCVMVRDLGGDSAGVDTSYSLTVLQSPSAQGADSYEPDDSPAEATPLDSDGTRQTHTFHTTTDVDYLSFVAQQGRQYTIQTGGLQSACDTIIYLYDESGAELDYDDDAGEDSLASLIVWTAPSTGVHYVKVEDFSGRAGPSVSYEIWISAQ